MDDLKLQLLQEKKLWIKPEVLVISASIKSGVQTGRHEANFTDPNHTQYTTPNGLTLSASSGAYAKFVS